MYPNLKLEIFKHGIRQNHLARALGIDETILSRIIHGYREPSATLRKMLADYLQAEENWLFEKYNNAGSPVVTSSALHGQAAKDEST